MIAGGLILMVLVAFHVWAFRRGFRPRRSDAAVASFTGRRISSDPIEPR